MPPKKTDLPETVSPLPETEDLVAEPAPAFPLPSGGGCYVIEAGELKQSQEPTRDVRAALDLVEGGVK